MLELLIVIILLLWLLGYFGRGRFYGRDLTGPASVGSVIHILLVIVVVLAIVRLLQS